MSLNGVQTTNMKKILLILGGVVLLTVILAFAGFKPLVGIKNFLTAAVGGRPNSEGVTHYRNLIDSTGAIYGTVEVTDGMTNPPRDNKMAIDDPEYLESIADARGVIIELSGDPVLKVKGKSLKAGKSKAEANQDGQEALTRIKAQHGKVLKVVEEKIKQKYRKSLDFSGKKVNGKIRAMEFTDAINGFAITGVPVKETIELLSGVSSDIVSVTPDPILHTELVQSVPMIHANDVWQYLGPNGFPNDGTGIKVGVIDTGIDYTHPDLGGCIGVGCKVLGGYDFQNGDTIPMDDHGHGTHVAATVAGNGSFVPNGSSTLTPILGVAPGANLYAYKVCNSGGACGGSAIISGIQKCVADGNQVCTISLGASTGNPDDSLSVAVDNAVAAGAVLTIAAGNAGPASGTIGSPGTARNAITVAAVDKSGNMASFSSRGPVTWTNASGVTQTIIKPDIAAPGVGICAAQWDSAWNSSTCGSGGHVSISGTSMATPHIAGVAALLLQAHPTLTPADVKNLIKSGATDNPTVAETSEGAGIVNVLESLILSGEPTNIVSLTNLPLIFSDPITTRLANFQKTIRVKNNTTGTLNFTTSYTQPTGITNVTFSPSTLSLTPGQESDLTITLQVDHSIVSSPGVLSGTVKLASSGGDVTLGTKVTLTSRINSSKSTIDFGDDNVANPSWTSTQTVNLTSTLTDMPNGPYTVSVVCCTKAGSSTPENISVTKSLETFTLQPGTPVNLSLTASIPNNSAFANGTYNGTLTLTSALETKRIPVTFFKGYFVNANFTGVIPNSIEVNDSSMSACVYPTSATFPIRFTSGTGPYNLIAHYNVGSCGGYDYGLSNLAVNLGTFVIKPNVTAGSTVSFDKSEANKNIYFSPTRPNGGNGIFKIAIGVMDKTFGRSVYSYDWGNFQGYPGFYGSYISVNQLGPALEINASGNDIDATGSIISTYLYNLNRPLSSSLTLSNTANSFTQKNIIGFTNGYASSSIVVTPKWCLGTSCQGNGSGYAGYSRIPLTASTKLYNYTVNDGIPTSNISGGFPSFKLGLGVDAGPGTLQMTSLYTTPQLFVTPTNTYMWRVNTGNVKEAMTIETVPGNNILLGAGPVFDVMKWSTYSDNYSYMTSSQGLYSPFYELGSGSRPWKSQNDEVHTYISQYVPTYTLKVNGSLIDSGTISASFPTFSASGMNYPIPKLPSGRIYTGAYDYTLTLNPKINGIQTTSTTKYTFNVINGEIDQNPPYLINLHLLSGGIWQHIIDNTKVNTLSFTLTPNPGNSTDSIFYGGPPMPDNLVGVNLSSSSDNGTTWTPVTLTQSGNTFTSSAIPVSGGASLYTLKINASDLAGNTYTYQFQLPTGTALTSSGGGGGGGDVTPPVISNVASSSVGATSAVISWTTNEQADGQVVYGTTPGSYTSSWPTVPDSTLSTSHNISLSGLTSGATYYYRVKSKDAAGNQSTSNEFTFTTTSGAGDLTAPTVSITSPASSTLPNNGNVNVTVNANDPSTISFISIVIDGVEKKRCNLAVTCTYKWNMGGQNGPASGNHTINGNAQDNSPNHNQGNATKTVTKP